jgi:hypothetical protein
MCGGPRHQEFFRVTSTDPKRMSSARHEFVQQLQALGDRGCAEYGDTGGIAAGRPAGAPDRPPARTIDRIGLAMTRRGTAEQESHITFLCGKGG